MKCQEFAARVGDYVDGDLTPEDSAAMRTHIEVCAACSRYFDSYKKTVRLSKEAFDEHGSSEELPEDLVAAILAKIRTKT